MIVVIGDIAKDRNALKLYLLNDLGLSKEVTEALLTGSVSYAQVRIYNYLILLHFYVDLKRQD